MHIGVHSIFGQVMIPSEFLWISIFRLARSCDFKGFSDGNEPACELCSRCIFHLIFGFTFWRKNYPILFPPNERQTWNKISGINSTSTCSLGFTRQPGHYRKKTSQDRFRRKVSEHFRNSRCDWWAVNFQPIEKGFIADLSKDTIWRRREKYFCKEKENAFCDRRKFICHIEKPVW